jgi:hypothetical protein
VSARTQTADRRAWGLTAILTVAAVAFFFAIRNLPLATGSLHYTDFHAGEKSFLEFCEPGGPQFAPVDQVQSPVRLTILPEHLGRAGEPIRARATLTTLAGKPVAAGDLLTVHTERLHLLIVDASLDDYHHVHPQPTGVPGEFAFQFTPTSGGSYRFFADFTPRATGRALYAGASLVVGGAADQGVATARPNRRTWRSHETAAHRFTLEGADTTLRINETADLVVRVERLDGGPVELEEIMGAKAHLVAFDEGCTGFAHLHPTEATDAPTGAAQKLGFALNLADPGYYRLWAQVKIDGREVFAPFGLQVEP